MQPFPASLSRAAIGALAVMFVSVLTPAVGAPLSTNDTCASAVVVPGSGPFPYLTSVIDISNATTNGDPVLPLSAEQDNESVTNSVWFKFIPASGGTYHLSLGVDTATTIEDTFLAVFRSSGGCAGPMNFVDSNDDSGSELRSGLEVTLSGGNTYYIMAWVGPIEILTNQPLDLQLRVSKPVVPANDDCAGAHQIPTGGPFPYLTPVFDTTLADEADDPEETGCAFFGIRSLWFRFSPANTGAYVFSTASDTATTVEDTVMTLYRNTGGCSGDFEVAGCNDNPTPFGPAVLTANLTNGITYYLIIWDNSDFVVGETSLQLSVGRPGPPMVTTLPAMSINTTAATLRAQVNPNGYQARYWFEWGVTTNYTSTNTARLLNTGIATITTNANLTAFLPGLTYHYRAVATNIAGKTFGADQTFHTQPIITSPMMLPGGEFKLQFTGTVGLTYIVLGSTNLTTWTDIGPATDRGGGLFELIHPGNSGVAFRFYQVRLP